MVTTGNENVGVGVIVNVGVIVGVKVIVGVNVSVGVKVNVGWGVSVAGLAVAVTVSCATGETPQAKRKVIANSKNPNLLIMICTSLSPYLFILRPRIAPQGVGVTSNLARHR